MAAGEIHVGDVGLAFRATLRDQTNSIVNISLASGLALNFLKPDKSVVSKVATLYTDGTDGIFQYVTQTTSDLDQTGDWKIQGHLILSSQDHNTDINNFRVLANII